MQRFALVSICALSISCDPVAAPGTDGGDPPRDGGPVVREDSGQGADPLDDLLRGLITTNELVPNVGVAIAVIEHGEVRFVGTYGDRDRERGLPVTPDTIFAVGSTTKAMTGFIALSLAEEGTLDLEQPVVERMPDFVVADPVANAQMNAIDLMTHRAGLARHDFMWLDGHYSRGEIYDRMRYLEDDPGSGFRTSIIYNNLMYMVSGLLMERATGSTWETLVEQRIFDPLAMTRTVSSTAAFTGDANHALGYVGGVPISSTDTDAIAPAGGVASSVHDMARWTQMLIAGGVAPSGDRLIESATLERAFEAHNELLPEDDYGLGWAVKDLGGYRFIGHGGHLFGYFASVSFIPELGLGVVALFNDDLTLLSIPVVEGAWDALLASDEYPASARGAVSDYLDYASTIHGLIIPKPRDEEPAFLYTQPSLEGARASATFHHPGYGDLRVVELATPGTYAIDWRGNVWPLTCSIIVEPGTPCPALLYYVTRYSAGRFTYLTMTFVLNDALEIVALTIPFGTAEVQSRFDRVF